MSGFFSFEIITIVLIGISAICCIVGQERENTPVVFLFKPLTMILILIYLFSSVSTWGSYAWLIFAGLFISMVGDVFLMLPEDHFLQGLVSFLIAHLFYLGAFYFRAGFNATIELWIPLAVYTLAMLWMLLPRAGNLKIPVLIYVVVLFLMGWQALELWSFAGNRGIYTCVGGLLFMISDSALGWNRFRGPFPFSSMVVLGTYFPAQFFLASSI